MKNFKEGDTVRLESGGPAMTVLQEIDDKHVECCWFDDSIYKKAIFLRSSLAHSKSDNDMLLEQAILFYKE